MHRFMVAVFLLLSAICSFAQVAQPTPLSDPLAVSLAQKAVAVLTGGVPVSDVTLNANVISILGSDNETGTGTFTAKGLIESRVDLNLSGGGRSPRGHNPKSAPATAAATKRDRSSRLPPPHPTTFTRPTFSPPLCL